MSAAGLLLGLFGTGHLLLAALRPRRARSVLELHATAATLGAALLATAYSARASLGADPATAAAWARGLLVLGALGLVPALLATLRARREAPEREPFSPAHIAGVALVLTLAALAVFNAASMPVHVFDPLYHFAHKGKLVYHEGVGTAAWTDLGRPVGRVLTHPSYPPGIASLQSLASGLAGRFDAEAARAALGALFALAPAAWLYAALRPRGRGAALCGALLWLGLPLLYYTQAPNDRPHLAAFGLLFGHEEGARRFPGMGPWFQTDGWVLDGAGDLPLAALALGALLHLSRGVTGTASDRADLVVGGVLLAGAALVKNEGLALAAVLALSLGAAASLSPRPAGPALRALLLPALLFAVCVIPWLLVRRTIPSIDEAYPTLLTPAGLAGNLHRAGEVAGGFLAAFTNALRWNLLWPLFGATLLWRALAPRELRAHPALPAVLFVLGGILLYAAVLLVTPWDLEVLFTTVIPGRLLLHLAPAAILATCALLWRLPGETDPEALA